MCGEIAVQVREVADRTVLHLGDVVLHFGDAVDTVHYLRETVLEAVDTAW